MGAVGAVALDLPELIYLYGYEFRSEALEG